MRILLIGPLMDPRDFRQTPKLLKYLVDLIGIEPMTSSMP